MIFITLADARNARDKLNERGYSGRYYVTYEDDGTYSIRFTYKTYLQVAEIN